MINLKTISIFFIIIFLILYDLLVDYKYSVLLTGISIYCVNLD